VRRLKRMLQGKNTQNAISNVFDYGMHRRKVKTYFLNHLLARQKVQALSYIFYRNFDVLKMAGINVSHRRLPESLGENEEKPIEYPIYFFNNPFERYYTKRNRFWSFMFYYN
jgi:hypothetical protein